MSEFKNVVVIGASGSLGPHVLEALLESSSFNVTALSRQGSNSTYPSGVKVVHADYSSQDSLTAAFKGQDAVLSFVGVQGFKDQQRLIDAAIAAGVKRFIPSEYGGNTRDERVLSQITIAALKVNAVKYLQSKEDQISWTAIITGIFFDWGIRVGFFGFDIASNTVSLIDDGKPTWSTTNLAQIARAVVKVLEKPDLAKNQYVYISDFQTSQRAILDAAEKITGQKWTVKNEETGKELRERGGAILETGDLSGAWDMIRGCSFGAGDLGNFEAEGLWNDKLGLPKENFEETIKTVLTGQ
ncbi:NAD(P)-binding protein [Periconia macrospinosa]|uniref:NAD(P)-binding protein n=1 Tax=Periconia macrospinosa TaxID=97972 RepID=A0A2V1D7G9_9PLEO|nr:NAD(P)-binding protein [Periconia macrospinosa]